MSRLRLLTDIRTWLLLSILIRLIGLTEPPLEATHSWRQAFTNMVARNLAEGPFDLMHPRTSMAGERPDVVASEFPGFNALIAMMIRVFGPAHWYGRLIALLVSVLGCWSFHQLLRRHFGDRLALHATLILLGSSLFLYGRKAMPDAFCVGLMLCSIDAADRGLRARRVGWLVVAGLLFMFGGLCKIPAVVIGGAIPLMAWRSPEPPRWRLGLLVTYGLAFIPVAWWYFHWQPHLLRSFGNALYFPVPAWVGLQELLQHGWQTFERFAFSALLGFIPFAACVGGLILGLRRRDPRIALLGLCIFPPFLYFMLRAGSVFALHGYYVLPMVPWMALCAGQLTSALPIRAWRVAALLLLAVEGLGLRWIDLHPSEANLHLSAAEDLADRFTAPSELVATTGELDPRAMYFLHRHGWSLRNDQLTDQGFLDSLQRLGLRTVFVDRHVCNELLPWTLVHEDPHWRVYTPAMPASGSAIHVP